MAVGLVLPVCARVPVWGRIIGVWCGGTGTRLKRSLKAIKGNAPRRCMTTIHLDRKEVLAFEPISIHVTGLKPEQPVTLSATTTEGNTSFDAHAHYKADENGKIDLEGQASLSGSYTGIEPMGLFWSLQQTPGSRPGAQLVKRNVDTPVAFDINVLDGWVPRDDLASAHVLACAIHQRWYKSQDVEKVSVRAGNLRGSLFIPTGNGLYPGVIDMYGTGGGLNESRASLLASKGFVTYALPFFNYQDLPPTMEGISFDYFSEAVQFMQGHPRVKTNGLGIIGLSKGAELAIMMSIHLSGIKAIVTINGFPYFTKYPMTFRADVMYPTVPFDTSSCRMEDGALNISPMYPADPSIMLPIWDTDCKVLNLVGKDDLAKSYEVEAIYQEEFRSRKPNNLDMVVYPNVGHMFDLPYSMHCRVAYHNLFKSLIWYGGRPKDHARAQVDAWQRIVKFFQKNL